MKLIAELRALRPSMRIIMISGYFLADDVRILEAVRTAAIDGFLAKPFQIEAIVAAALGHGKRASPPARLGRAARHSPAGVRAGFAVSAKKSEFVNDFFLPAKHRSGPALALYDAPEGSAPDPVN